MADFGMMTWDATGKVTFDSRVAQGGVVGAAVEVAPGATQTVSFPLFPGRTVRFISAFQGGTFTSVDYSAGYPVVTLKTPAGFLQAMQFIILLY